MKNQEDLQPSARDKRLGTKYLITEQRRPR